jgi:hypothetical protein
MKKNGRASILRAGKRKWGSGRRGKKRGGGEKKEEKQG